jgi:hypothetical protein
MKKKKAKEATVPVNIKDVPRNLRDHWKAWCALYGVTMRDSFVAMVRETIQKGKK